MSPFVCPWWGGYFIDHRWRRLLHDPRRIVGPYVAPGMTVVDVGCGMGIFAIAMAEMVGPSGQVIAIDVQEPMLRALRRRAQRRGVASRIVAHLAQPDRLGLVAPADFVLAFAMVHETPNQDRFLAELCGWLRPAAHFLVAEPVVHVPRRDFNETLARIAAQGLALVARPAVRLMRAAVFCRPAR